MLSIGNERLVEARRTRKTTCGCQKPRYPHNANGALVSLVYVFQPFLRLSRLVTSNFLNTSRSSAVSIQIMVPFDLRHLGFVRLPRQTIEFESKAAPQLRVKSNFNTSNLKPFVLYSIRSFSESSLLNSDTAC